MIAWNEKEQIFQGSHDVRPWFKGYGKTADDCQKMLEDTYKAHTTWFDRFMDWFSSKM